MNWTGLLKNRRYPSPLIIESENADELIQKIANHVFCVSANHCGQCQGCKKVNKGYHPDWIRIKEDFSIADLKEALRGIRQKPFESKYRLLSLENLDPNQTQAQNALLKTLEEPQKSWIILLGTTSTSRLLPTVRSRCLKVKWKSSAQEDMSQEDEDLFLAIQNQEPVLTQALLEPLLKSRDTAHQGFRRLLKAASQRQYPGHWMRLAPSLEPCLSELDRNLNQKIVWDKAWAQSLL